MITLPGNIKINGCLSIQRFAPGEVISITQQESVILKTAKAGRGEETIIEATRKGILHRIVLTKLPKGDHLYKVESFSPTPKL